MFLILDQEKSELINKELFGTSLGGIIGTIGFTDLKSGGDTATASVSLELVLYEHTRQQEVQNSRDENGGCSHG